MTLLRNHRRIIGHILKNMRKNKSILIIFLLIIVEMKNRSHSYDINRSRPRHGHKFIKYKKCLIMMMY